LKIAVTGPESSGKTSLTNWISKHFSMFQIDEYAREYLLQMKRPYDLDDVICIAKEQHRRIVQAPFGNVVVDTESIVSRIWIEEKFGKHFDWIEDQIRNEQFDLYILCSPDMPWEEDPLRENPLDRDRLFENYQKVLEQMKMKSLISSGPLIERQKFLVENMMSFLHAK